MRPAVAKALVLLMLAAGPAKAQVDPNDVSGGATMAPDIEALNPLASADSPERGAFVARPLFAPNRRPPPAKEAGSEPQAPVVPPLNLMLVGVMQTPEQRIARVVDRNAGDRRYSLRVGDYLGDWRVEEVGVRNIRLNKNGEVLDFTVGQ